MMSLQNQSGTESQLSLFEKTFMEVSTQLCISSHEMSKVLGRIHFKLLLLTILTAWLSLLTLNMLQHSVLVFVPAYIEAQCAFADNLKVDLRGGPSEVDGFHANKFTRLPF